MTAAQDQLKSTETLWREFSEPLRAYLRKRTSNAADADDLLQEVFVRIHRQLPSLREPSKLQGWIYRIARNAVIDRARSRRHAVSSNDVAGLPNETDDPTGRDVVDLTPTLRRFIARLPVHYREPLVLHEFQGQSLQSVGEALGLTLTAAKSRVRRARLLLRKWLDECRRFAFDRRGHVIDVTSRSATCDCRPSSDSSNPAVHSALTNCCPTC